MSHKNRDKNHSNMNSNNKKKKKKKIEMKHNEMNNIDNTKLITVK